MYASEKLAAAGTLDDLAALEALDPEGVRYSEFPALRAVKR